MTTIPSRLSCELDSPWLALADRCGSESFREARFDVRVKSGEIEPTDVEIAKVFEIDPSRVRQIAIAAIAKLARNRKALELARQFEEQRNERPGDGV